MSEIQPPKDRPYAVAEVFDNDRTEMYVFPIATVWLECIKACFDHDGSSQLKATMYWPANDDDLTEMLLRRPLPDGSERWVKGEGHILKFCNTLGSAKDGATQAEYDSSLESDGVVLTKKRARKPPCRFNPDKLADEADKAGQKNAKRVCKAGHSKDQDQKPLLLQRHNKIDCKSMSSNQKSSPMNEVQRGNAKPIEKEVGEGHKKITNATHNNGDRSAVEETEDIVMKDPVSDKNAEVPKMKAALEETVASPVPFEENFQDLADGSFLSSPLTSHPSRTEGSPAAATTSLFSSPGLNVSRREDTEINIISITGKVQRSPDKVLRSPSQARSPRKQLFPGRSSIGHVTGAVTALSFAREMKALNEKMDNLSVNVNAIYMSTCPAILSGKKDKRALDIPTLPVANDEGVQHLSEFVSVTEQMLVIVNLLADFGGSNLKDTVVGIMKRLLSNNVARFYNMEGINRKQGGEAIQKIGLRSTFMYNIVLSAVKTRADKLLKQRKVDIKYDVDACDGFISAWLKDAPQRFKNESRKKSLEKQDGARETSLGGGGCADLDSSTALDE